MKSRKIFAGFGSLLIASWAGIVSGSGCIASSKDWICACRVSAFFISYEVNYILPNQTRKDAQVICSEIEKDLSNATCEIQGRVK